MHGLNQYDFHARQYDPAIGKFTTVDPLAEKYYSISPYVYCANNPMLNIDPGGDSTRVYTETQGLGHTWMSTGEGDGMKIYSYGNYVRGTKEGILLKYVGEDAKRYQDYKSSTTEVSSYVITDIDDATVDNIVDNILNSSDGNVKITQKKIKNQLKNKLTVIVPFLITVQLLFQM